MVGVSQDKSKWVVGEVLAGHARARGDAPFLCFPPAPPLTYAQVDARSNQLANGLKGLHIARAERVGVMLPNGLEYCLSWFALSRLAAVHVSINTAYKGGFLIHVLNNAQARIVILHADYLQWLANVEDEVPAVETAIVVGMEAGSPPAPLRRIKVLPFGEMFSEDATPPGITVHHWEIGGIQYTSGTTGPSKGVLMPHAHLYLLGWGTVENFALRPDDVYYISMPLFHANAMLMQLYSTLIAGAQAVIVPHFSASGWLPDIRAHGATITNTLGVMTEFIFRQPPSADDGDHNLRVICAIPAPKEIKDDFEARFNTRLIEAYGMTEINIVTYHPMDTPYRLGSCGKSYDRYFEMAIVHPDTDEPLPDGEVGEIVARPREANCFMQGYNAMPEKTVEAWRNFWFHTGDAGYRDADGYYYFVDRIKDRIRVRGENISSYEVEMVVADYPGVEEVAAIAVSAGIAGGEDEIKVCVVPRQDASAIDPVALLDFCQTRMPYFAVPRYVEIMPALPKTPTQKVRKAALREEGITPATWDRASINYQVRKKA